MSIKYFCEECPQVINEPEIGHFTVKGKNDIDYEVYVLNGRYGTPLNEGDLIHDLKHPAHVCLKCTITLLIKLRDNIKSKK